MSELLFQCYYCRKKLESGEECFCFVKKEPKEPPLSPEEQKSVWGDDIVEPRSFLQNLCAEYGILFRSLTYADEQPFYVDHLSHDGLDEYNVLLVFGVYDVMRDFYKDIERIKALIGNKRGPEFTMIEGPSNYDCSYVYILRSDDPRLDSRFSPLS